jgi:hypothetical protein
VGRERLGVVALVVAVGALGEGLADLGDERVVVGDVGGEAANLGVAVARAAGQLDNLGKFLGRY